MKRRGHHGPAQDRRLRAAGFRRDERGASEIVGSVLLIGITVLLVSGLAVLILNVKPPADTLHADLSMLVTRGADGAWNTGDEQVQVQHMGGEAVPRDGFSIEIDISGTVTTYSGAGLGGAFDDGELTVGETWNATVKVSSGTDIFIEAVLTWGGASTLLQSERIRAGNACDVDSIPPDVADWTQSPADVTTTTTGAVTVTVLVVDACNTVDGGIDPHLWFRINDGTDPAFTDRGAMTSAGSASWTLDIPDQTWTLLTGDSLQYKVTGMTDTKGNAGDSTIRTDTIQLTGTNTYTSAYTQNVGTLTGFSNARSDSDGGAAATLTEDATGAGTAPYYATTASGSGGTGDPLDADGAADDLRYSIDDLNDQVTVSSIDTTGASGSISKVELVFEGHYTNSRTNDVLDLRVHDGSIWSTVLNDYVPAQGTDAQRVVDITGVHATWDWTKVGNLQLRAVYEKVAATDAMVIHVDSMWVHVTFGATNTDMDIELQFPSLPAAPTHVLEIRYSTSQETFRVEVWDGAAWNQRGVTLSSASMTTYLYELTGTEAVANSGAPLIRIVDSSTTSPQGTLQLDYVRVVSG